MNDITNIVQACIERELEEWEQEGAEEAACDRDTKGGYCDNAYPIDVGMFVERLCDEFEDDEGGWTEVLREVYSAAFAVGFNAEAQRWAENIEFLKV